MPERDFRFGLFSDALFADPFLDMASAYMPETIQSALRWCEYIFMTNGTYRQAVDRILSYFITDIEIIGDDNEEKKKWNEFLEDHLNVRQLLHTIGLDAMCLSGDTEVITDQGPEKLENLLNKKFNVLTKDGLYREATCKSYGEQELFRVNFSSGRYVYATKDHLWYKLYNFNSSESLESVVTTEQLNPGSIIPLATSKNIQKNTELTGTGVCHGFWFGKSLIKDSKRFDFCELDNKFLEIKEYFKKYGQNFYCVDEGDSIFYIRLKDINTNPHVKLPKSCEPDCYWLGFFRGLVAASFYASSSDFIIIAGTDYDALAEIYKQVPRIGWVAGSIIKNGNIYNDLKINSHNLFFLTINANCLTYEDLILSQHRKNIRIENCFEKSNYDIVTEVLPTNKKEFVYCITEPVTNSFVLASGLVTHNCYGNAFVSVLPTFKRYLSCPTENCGLMLPLAEVYENPIFRFEWRNFEFIASCPQCKKRSSWKRHDFKISDQNGLRVRRWSPHEIELIWDLLTDDIAYLWKIPEYYRRIIREGRLHHLERVSWEVVEAIKNNQFLLFEPGFVFHMKEDALAGVNNRGWGISRTLVNFRQAWYAQVLHRYNEGLALDYIIPFRLITPAPGDKSAGTDPLLNQNLGGFMAKVRAMLAQRRRDPAAWHTLPFPVQYQVLGGEARQMVPHELINQAQENLLNSLGVPVELYRGTLQLQAAPASLRLFEASMSSIPRNFNNILRFLVRQISQIMTWESVGIKLSRVTHADDLQRQQTKLQLMMGGQVSPSTGLKSVGLDYHEEVRRSVEDQRFAQEYQAKIEEEMQVKDQMSSVLPAPGSVAAVIQQQVAQSMSQGAGEGQPMAGQPAAGPAGAAGAAPAPAQPAPGGAGAGPAPPPPQGMAQVPPGQDLLSAYIPQPNMPITPEELNLRAQQLAQQIMGLSESEKDSTLIRLSKQHPVLHAIVSKIIESIRQDARRRGGASVLSQQFGRQF